MPAPAVLSARSVNTGIADGADVSQGARADTAWVSGNGTVISVLKGIFGKLAAALSVTPTKLGQTSRLPLWATGQVITTSATTAKTAALTGTEVIISPTADVWVNIGTQSSIVATKGAGSMFLPKGRLYMFQITSGQGVAAIMDTVAGVVTVHPVA